MTIQPSDPRSTPAIAAASSLRADGAASGDVEATRPSGPASPPSDRVELSDDARAYAGSESAGSSEVDRARVALRAGGGLSAGRLHELREQVRTGHFDSPEAIDRIAGAAAEHLGTRDA